MSWLSEGISKIGDFWNQQPTWAKGLEIGGAAALTGGLGLGLAGIGPAAGLFGAEAGLGGAAATTGGIDAITTGAAVGSAEAGGLGGAGAAGPLAWDISGFAGGGGGGLAGVTDPEALAQLSAAGYSQPTYATAGGMGGAAEAAGGTPASETFGWNLTGSGLPGAESDPWSLSGIGSSLAPKSAGQAVGALAGVGGLGYNLYQGQQQKQELAKLEQMIQGEAKSTDQARQQAMAAVQPELAMGAGLQQYLTSNTLPANATAQIDQWYQGARAQMIQGYASRGQSADPLQNSGLQKDLAALDQQKLSLEQQMQTNYFNAGTQAMQQANSLIASGLNAARISAELPMAMQKLDMELSNQTSQAIAAFAKGLTPMGGGQGGGQQFTIQQAA